MITFRKALIHFNRLAGSRHSPAETLAAWIATQHIEHAR